MESYSKLEIICPDEENELPHPHCLHGPTLLFQTPSHGCAEQTHGYFACAAHRDKRFCNFRLSAEDVTPNKLARNYDLKDVIDEYKQQRTKLLAAYTGNVRHYCLSCNIPLLPDEKTSHASHEIQLKLTRELLCDPTSFLPPLDSDKSQAQYFFDRKALQFFAKCFKDLNITKVVCMGAPRLHAFLRNECTDVRSFLLDFDHRMFYFYEDYNFGWYNLCNNHFFDAQQRREFDEFLKCTTTDRLLILTDPPFGCRTEPIAATLRQLTRRFNILNHLPHQPLPIFWIFPYFAEHYIQREMPQMCMCDYKVNYTNHSAYTDVGEKCRSLGSPVRVFTNVPLELIHLPVEEEYKYCTVCQCYTALENRHCMKCDTCPSKNGSAYRHCDRCACCVKPSYVHCDNCRRCTQLEGHDCRLYQSNQHCWICLQKGHTEFECAAWRKHCKRAFPSVRDKKIITCLLCRRKGHNERNCLQRGRYIEDVTFLGTTVIKFK